MSLDVASSAMTSRERFLAAVDLKPVDRLPFWPKIGSAYANARTGRFANWSIPELHDYIGSDLHEGVGGILRTVRKHTDQQFDPGDGRTRSHRFVTPQGTLTRVEQFDSDSDSWHPVRFPVQTREDIEVMTAWYEDGTIDLDRERLEQARQRHASVGDRGVSHSGVGESALMHFIEWIAGVENAHYLLADYPDETAALFDAIHRHLLRCTEIIAEHHPADLIYFVENTSTTLISVDQYQRLDWPHLYEYGKLLRQAGRRMILHMCGHLKRLLPDLARLPVSGFEAFTAPTLGNTTLLDGRTQCPDKCLIGGTHAMLWLEPAEKIIETIETRLDELPHHRGLVITSAGVMPPACEPETIREVCERVQSYPVRL